MSVATEALTFHLRVIQRAYHVLELGLVSADAPSELIVSLDEAAGPPLPSQVRPVLALGARVYMETPERLHIRHTLSEPEIESWSGGVTLTRFDRTLIITGRLRPMWAVLELLDGERTVTEIADAVPEGGRLQSILALAGVLDCSDRATARLLHAGTTKGMLPTGQLTRTEIMELTATLPHGTGAGRSVQALHPVIPDELMPLYALTRARRSTLDYRRVPITRAELAAILETACGITGTSAWNDREIPLRAYPSSGGLYAVNVLLAAFDVTGLDPGLYRYAPSDSALEEVKAGDLRAEFAAAAVPGQHTSIRNVAAMVCLTANFPRHERKYGAGGYRMLAAEAGHISQAIILACTALGLKARPCGGLFDRLVNATLSLDVLVEQFLLSVLIGRDGE